MKLFRSSLFMICLLLNVQCGISIAATKFFLHEKDRASADSLTTSVWTDFNTGLDTGIKIFSSPAHFATRDWIYTGAAIVSTGLIIFADNDIRNGFRRNHSQVVDNIAEVGYRYGNAAYAVAFSGLLYLGGKISDDEKISTTGRMLLESLFYAGVTTTVIKSLVGRNRPYTEDGPYRINGFQFNTGTTSMPSGHVTVAFAMSSVLAERIDNVYASVFLYTLAASTVFQRMYSDNHWASDCIPAAVIGYTIGKAVVNFDNGFNKKVNVSAGYVPNGAGLNFVYVID